VRFDLLDCHIYACSPELLVQFSDNFDYQDIRRDLVHGLLNDSVMSKHVFSHIVCS
jgi:translation initiation factor eIF-2B subunit epsilon